MLLNLHVFDVIWSHDPWTNYACENPQTAPQVLRSHLNGFLGICADSQNATQVPHIHWDT